MKGSHAEECKHYTVITVCNRRVTECVGLCMQENAGFCHAFVQSAERNSVKVLTAFLVTGG